jgi:5-(carboxyamino)imidazole ribonucleotide mutase
MSSKKTKRTGAKATPPKVAPLVGVVMGSKSDWETMSHAVALLGEFGVPCEYRVVSAHRMPDAMAIYAKEASGKGLLAIIAGAGGAAHLPGMIAAQTTVPVLGVPVKSRTMEGFDSLLSIVQMPAGIPVATFAIGEAGAKNAALFAIAHLALLHQGLSAKLAAFRKNQTKVAEESALKAPKKLRLKR